MVWENFEDAKAKKVAKLKVKKASEQKQKEIVEDPRYAKREQVKARFSNDECLDFWHRYKERLRTEGFTGYQLGIDEGKANKDTAFDPKRLVELSYIAKVISKTMYIVKDREEKGQTVSLQEEARILDWQYEKVLDDESSMY